LLAFILTTCCFSLWGFANDFTNPLVKVYENVFIFGSSESTWLQFAFYTGYFCMALPAAFFIRKYSYKGAIMVGFFFYALGALIAVPASLMASFWVFCIGSYILTYGLAFLETACNPYILSMGDPRTATQRLNLAQAFNPIGSLCGMFVASQLLAPNLLTEKFRTDLGEKNEAVTQYLLTDASNLPEGATTRIEGEGDGQKTIVTFADEKMTEVNLYHDGLPDFDTQVGALDSATTDALKGFRELDAEGFANFQAEDLASVRLPYVIVAAVVLVFLIIFFIAKMPTLKSADDAPDAPFGEICARIFSRGHFTGGVIAQGFYVGAQIMCWTFIVHYGMEECGLTLSQAQTWNIVAMIIFLSSRWICTALLRIVSAGKLLFIFSLGGILFTVGAIFLKGDLFTVNLLGKELAANTGLLSLVMISACMSLMFPTIYGIALNGMKSEEAKLGSAFLIMSIVGGAVLTKLQGVVKDAADIRASFWLPVICFAVIAVYGFLTFSKFEKEDA
ncbi:MAG: MFS transporter, partial [Akkermansiaceae bacterium]